MSLKDQITEDMKTAMRAKDSERLGTIRLLMAAMKQKEVDERVVLDDAAIVAIVDKLIKQRKDSIEAFVKAERQELADKEAAEMKVLQAYLPQRMSAEEVLVEVKAIVARTGSDELGLDPMGLNETDTFLVLQPKSTWRGSKEDIIDRLREVCVTPQRAVDVLDLLFERKIEGHHVMFAVGEAIAHLHTLWHQGQLTRAVDEAGVYRFKAKAEWIRS